MPDLTIKGFKANMENQRVLDKAILDKIVEQNCIFMNLNQHSIIYTGVDGKLRDDLKERLVDISVDGKWFFDGTERVLCGDIK